MRGRRLPRFIGACCALAVTVAIAPNTAYADASLESAVATVADTQVADTAPLENQAESAQNVPQQQDVQNVLEENKANDDTQVPTPQPVLNGWVDDAVNGMVVRHWYDQGVMARSKEIFDPGSNAWYWIDADGTMARDKDVFQRSNGGKWVRYDHEGHMIKGEDYRYGGWYYFDPTTGAMDKGMAYLPKSKKWVYYDETTGRMQYGAHIVDGRHLYFDPATGRQWSKKEIVNLLVRTARSAYGKNIDAPGILAANGGITCPHGPCMAWVWWVFHTAGLDIFLADGADSGWPHHNYDWYRVRGRISNTPHVGDLAFFNFGGWASNLPVSHAAIVTRIEGKNVWVSDAAVGGIRERNATVRYARSFRGYAHPYYNE